MHSQRSVQAGAITKYIHRLEVVSKAAKTANSQEHFNAAARDQALIALGQLYAMDVNEAALDGVLLACDAAQDAAAHAPLA